MKKRVLILGGGIGGVVAATELAKRVGNKAHITLVEREASYEFAPSYLWVMIGTRSTERISVPVSKLERKGIEVIRGEVQSIDATAKAVVVSSQQLKADYIVAALGAETHMTGLEDVAAAGANLYSSKGVEFLRDARQGAQGKSIAIVVTSMPFKCPAAPYEAAMLLSQDLKSSRTDTRVSLYSPEPGPMPVAGEKVSAQMVQALQHRNVRYFPKHTVTGMATERALQFQDGTTAQFDLLAYVPKHRAPHVLVKAGLAPEGGWAPVDRHTLATAFPDVFVVGDSAGIPLKNGKALPKAGVFAHGQAEVVAQNIAASIRGEIPSHRFEGHGACFVEMGGGIAGKGSGNFYAEPNPDVAMSMPGPWNHWAKILFEKYWLGFKY